MSDLRRLLFANQTRAYEGYPLVISRSVASRYLKQYQMYGNSEQGVPAGYTPLESITFPSGAYIRTGIIPKTYDYEVGFKGAFGVTASGPNCAWGFIGTGTFPRWLCATYQNKYLLNANATLSFGDADTNTHTFVGRVYMKNSTPCWSSEFDGVIEQNDLALGNTDAWEAGTLEIYIGARNNQGAGGNYGLITANHWWCIKAGVMIADYIPAKRNSDNVLGMYDLVSNTFFTNAGTGTFTAGPVLPTPSNPIEVISVGDKTVNLFDSDIFLGVTDWQKNGDEYFGDMGKLFNKYFTSGMVSFNGKPNTQYTFSHNIKMDGTIYGGRVRIIYSDNSYTDLTAYLSTDKPNYKKITGTSENGKTIVGIKFPYTAGEGNAYFKEFMIEEGSTATSYVPYGYQIPVFAQGKNLWSLGDFTVSSASAKTFEGLDPNKTYTISMLASNDFATTSPDGWSVSPRNADGSSRGNIFYMRDYVAGQMVSTQFSGASMLRIQATGLTGSLSPMLTEGSVAPTSYAPYSAPITTPIYLNAPLRKVGDYADVLDYKKGQIIRNVGYKVLDGTENWTKYNDGKFALPLIGSKKKDNQEPPFCSHFIGISGDNVPATDGRVAVFNGSISATSGSLGINHQATQELAGFKAYLAQQYAAGTPVIVYYPLKTPVTESIVAPALPTMAGSTTYTTETEVKPSNMKGVF